MKLWRAEFKRFKTIALVVSILQLLLLILVTKAELLVEPRFRS